MSRRSPLSPVLAVVLLAAAPALAGQELVPAATRGEVEEVRTALRAGADPNRATGDGLSALHAAARGGHLEVARVLLAAGADVGARTRIGAYAPLHLAAAGGHTEVARALLDAGAEVAPVATTTGVTPLHLAAKALGGEAVVRLLLERGASVDAREASAGQTPLIFAAAAGRTEAVRALLAGGADPGLATEVVDVLRRVRIDREAEERLSAAAREIRTNSPEGTDRPLTAEEARRAIEAQRAFLASREEVGKTLEGFDADDLARMAPSWNTPSGYQSEVKIVARPRIETLVGATGGMTPLLHAAREGHVETARALLDGGADIDQVSGDGSSPLVLALLNGQFDLAMLLIERGANPDLATRTDGVSPLFAVLQTQWALKFTEHPAPRAHDNQGTTHMDVLNALLDAGADPNVRLRTHIWHVEYEAKSGLNFTGATPFWRAALAQDVDAMRALAEHGADPNVPSVWPEPGMREGRQPDGRLQEDSGLSILPEGTVNMYPIQAAAGGGYLGLGAFMMNNVPNNFLAAVRYLVEEHGADVNLPDGWGYTPLHYASVRGGDDVIEYLVSKGADVNAVSRLGQSVADMPRGGRAGYFSRTHYPRTVELLQSLGAEFRCADTHFRGTGDFCPGSGAPPFEHMAGEGSPAP